MTEKEFDDLQLGYTLHDLQTLRDEFRNGRMTLENTWKVLDAYDSGKFWDEIKVKLPKHQIIPDTNKVFYVKNNMINSVYSAPYLADVLPLDPADQDEARQINKLLEYAYNKHEIGNKQLQAGERAALLNVGFLQIGWNDDVTYTMGEGGKTVTQNGDIEVIVRDPKDVFLDPNFKDFQRGRALFIVTEDSSENLLAEYPACREELLALVKADEDRRRTGAQLLASAVNTDSVNNYHSLDVQKGSVGMFTVTIAYKMVADENGRRVDQVIYVAGSVVLEYKKGIVPECYPIVALYNLPPERDAYGVGVCSRILRNALSLNILDSIAVTHTYASQRTPLILDLRSGLNLARVAADMNNPDRIFPITSGTARDALVRMDYPELPRSLDIIRNGLSDAINEISGIDDRYTGRDTGSVTTTGGMERLQQRISLTDNTRIAMVEQYARNLSRMILEFYIAKGGKRAFVSVNNYEDPVKAVLTVDFDKYHDKKKNFVYSINATPLLPKTRQRLAEAANIIMQVQMQYGGQIQLLTPEEWMFFQDFPQKDMILDRMKIDRLRNDQQEIASELTSFGSLTEQGMRPEAAVEQLANERAIRREPNVQRKILQAQQK